MPVEAAKKLALKLKQRGEVGFSEGDSRNGELQKQARRAWKWSKNSIRGTMADFDMALSPRLHQDSVEMGNLVWTKAWASPEFIEALKKNSKRSYIEAIEWMHDHAKNGMAPTDEMIRMEMRICGGERLNWSPSGTFERAAEATPASRVMMHAKIIAQNNVYRERAQKVMKPLRALCAEVVAQRAISKSRVKPNYEIKAGTTDFSYLTKHKYAPTEANEPQQTGVVVTFTKE